MASAELTEFRVNISDFLRIHLPMSGNDILTRVRRAVHMADTLHAGDAVLAEQFLEAADRCRQANREFLVVIEQLRLPTAAGEAARQELQQHLSAFDCGDKLLGSMLDAAVGSESEIHTQTPPDQIQ